MIRRWMGVLLALSLAAFAGCSVEESDDGAAAYRAAIPPAETVTAAESPAAALGRTSALTTETAYYPQLGIPVARAVNGVVTGLFDAMRTLVTLPPTYLDPVEQLAAWGPFDNLDGDIVVVIQKDPAAAPGYQYLYQFWRVPEAWDGSLAAVSVIIGGVSNPFAAEGANGIFFVDFDADEAFSNFANPPYTLGGFSAAYAEVQVLPASETDVGGLLTLVVAAFRDFDPPNNLNPINVDYLYGHFVMNDGAGTKVDFLDFATAADIDGLGRSEALNVRMAFLNGGMGRAEVAAWGGDLREQVDGIECWDDQIIRQYLLMTQANTPVLEIGTLGSVNPLFQNTLDALHIPSLAGFNAENPTVLPLLSNLATLGYAGWPQ